MTSKQMVRASLAGAPLPRPVCGPLACHFCGRYYKIPLKEYTMDADKLADSVIRYYREFRPDAVWGNINAVSPLYNGIDRANPRTLVPKTFSEQRLQDVICGWTFAVGTSQTTRRTAGPSDTSKSM